MVLGITLYYSKKAVEAAIDAARSASAGVRIAGQELETATDSFNQTISEMKIQSAAMQATAQAAIDSIEVAKGGIDASIESSRNDIRAWVGPVSFEPVQWVNRNKVAEPPTGGQYPAFIVNVQNTGKSIARKYKCIVRTKVQNRELPFEPDHGPVEGILSESVIYPNMMVKNGTITEFQQGPFSAEVIAGINRGDILVYFYGHSTYEDIFGRQHMSNFCFLLNQDLKNLTAYHSHNEAD